MPKETIIDNAFRIIPKNEQSISLKAELDMEFNTLYNEFIANGDKKHIALKKASENFKNLKERIADLKPTDEFLESLKKHVNKTRVHGILGSVLINLGMFSGVMLRKIDDADPTLLDTSTLQIAVLAIIGTIIVGNIIGFLINMPLDKKIPEEFKEYMIQQNYGFDNEKNRKSLAGVLNKHWISYSIIFIGSLIFFSSTFVLIEWILTVITNPLAKITAVARPKTKK